MERLRTLIQWQIDCFANSRMRDFYAVGASEWRDIPDPAERNRLSKVTTSFDLQPEEVEALVAAGRALLRDNPEFRRVRAQLGGTAAE